MGKNTLYQCGPARVHVAAAGQRHVYVTAALSAPGPGPDSESSIVYEKIAEILHNEDLQIVHERIFGGLDARNAICQARAEVMGQGATGRGQVTYIEGRPCWGEGLAGINIHTVRSDESSGDVSPVRDRKGTPVGLRWGREGTKFLMLQNIHGILGDAQDNCPEVQAGRMFERAEKALRAQGATYRDVVRTWIYINDILSWYDRFNAVRNEKYQQFGIMPDLATKPGKQPISLPASTGIEGGNPMGAACVMDVLAITGPAENRPGIEQMTNIKQEDAFMYGSAFSRGACIREPDVSYILISGTAAIDEKGQTFDPHDVSAQIERTFDTVEALIAQKGATLKDICNANVFLKRAEDLSVYRQLAARRGITDIPAVCVNADVCRRELLFEMDGVAIVPR